MHIRLSLAAVAASLATAAIAQPASASIWTEIPSGTTQNITAIEYQSATRFWFTTSAGAIYTRQPNGTFARSPGPVAESRSTTSSSRAGGQIGLAVGSAGLVLRSVNGGAYPVPRSASAVGHVQLPGHGGRRRPQRRALRGQRAGVDLRRAGPDRTLPAGACAVGCRRGPGPTPTATRKGTATPADDTCRAELRTLQPGLRRRVLRRALPTSVTSSARASPAVFFTANNLASSVAEEGRGRRQRGKREARDRRRPGEPEPHVVGQRRALRPLDDRVHPRRLADRRLLADRQRHGARLPEHRPGRRRLRGRHRPRRR